MEITLDNGGGSYDEAARTAGIDPPMLKPGDEALDVLVTTQLYWPVVHSALQEERP